MFIYDDETTDGNLLKVKLKERRNYSNDGVNSRGRTAVFHVTPDLAESRSVNYKTVEPIHGPGQIYVYNNTNSRSFNLTNVKLISRTSEEATLNLAKLNLLRSWLMPVFGSTSGVVKSIAENTSTWDARGAPPPVLELSAYADHNRRGNLYRIPVVITQLGFQYPSDVDYIPTAAVRGYEHILPNTPFPTVMNFDMTLSETHSPRQYSNFSLSDYRLGNLETF